MFLLCRPAEPRSRRESRQGLQLYPTSRSAGCRFGSSARVSGLFIPLFISESYRTQRSDYSWAIICPAYILLTLFVPSRYHLCGWAPEDPEYAVQAGEYQKYLQSYQALAKELHICIVPGTVVERHVVKKTEKEGEEIRLYNTAYFISHDGQILGSYRKKNIWHPERPHLTSSGTDPHEVFDTPVGKIGFLICWDLAFPEAFRELIAKGAEIIIIPTYCESDLGQEKSSSL